MLLFLFQSLDFSVQSLFLLEQPPFISLKLVPSVTDFFFQLIFCPDAVLFRFQKNLLLLCFRILHRVLNDFAGTLLRNADSRLRNLLAVKHADDCANDQPNDNTTDDTYRIYEKHLPLFSFQSTVHFFSYPVSSACRTVYQKAKLHPPAGLLPHPKRFPVPDSPTGNLEKSLWEIPAFLARRIHHAFFILLLFRKSVKKQSASDRYSL